MAVGGVLTGEHGIGLEKRDFMPLQFDAVALDAQGTGTLRLRDPEQRFNTRTRCCPPEAVAAS